jgi:hypothetical protein
VIHEILMYFGMVFSKFQIVLDYAYHKVKIVCSGLLMVIYCDVLLGNGSVNTFLQLALCNMTSSAKQQNCKHAAITIRADTVC